MSISVDDIAVRLEQELGASWVTVDEPVREAHAVDGVRPRAVCRPADADQISAALRVCTEMGAAVAPWGGGSAVALGNIPQRVDVVLRTERLAALVEHDDANLTATVQSGMRMGQLQGVLLQRRQFLGIDAPQPDRATIGGVVAANTNGPRRMFYGGLRDLVIGMKMVLATGERIKAGGKVVKNVAGYDMCKLFVGSLGTLGIITEVTFKMAPLPERTVTIACSGTPAKAFALVDGLFSSKLQPSAIAVLNSGAAQAIQPLLPDGGAREPTSWAALIRVEGFTEAVDRHIRDISAMAGESGLQTQVLEGDPDDRIWAAVRDFPVDAGEEAVVRLTVPLASVAAAVESVSAQVESVSTQIQEGWIAHPGTGVIWLRLRAADARERFARAVEVAASHRGHAVLTTAPAEVKRGLDVWGAPPPALHIMREIKQRFDPERLLNPGRFVAFL